MRVWVVFSFFLKDKRAHVERNFLESVNKSQGYEVRRARMDNRLGPMMEVQTVETRTVLDQKKILTRLNFHIHSGIAWCNNQCYLHVYYRDVDCDARSTWIFMNDFARREEIVSMCRDHLVCDAKYVDTTRVEPKADQCVDIVSYPQTLVFKLFCPSVEFDDIRAAAEFTAACCEIVPRNNWTWKRCYDMFYKSFPEFSYMLHRMRNVRRATAFGNVYPPEYPAGTPVTSDDAPTYLETLVTSLNPFASSDSSSDSSRRGGSNAATTTTTMNTGYHIPASDFTTAWHN